jgi:hypothetical protein
MSRVRVLLNILESNAAVIHAAHHNPTCRNCGLKTLPTSDPATLINHALWGLVNGMFPVRGQTL